MAASIVSKIFLGNCRNISRMQREWNVKHVNSLRRILTRHVEIRTISCQSCLMSDKMLPASDLKKLMESLTDKFAEAREMLDDARESQGTVYFSEDIEEAQAAVNETLTEYKDLLSKLSDAQRQQVISTLGLRMEELKAQQAAIEDSLKD